ncbi:CHAP domain-containing protein [Mesorhizobium abyssinicae]|uniref:CHAP domain-containing protein n=1 Tax=Mesorhizobium abyssinicae TaxID=1209958 RepID=UPI00387DC787
MEWPRDRPRNPQPANPIIVAFFAATDTEPFEGDQTAWCAAFACWTLKRAGHKSPHSAGSKAFRSWGAPTDDPKVGDLAVFKNKTHPLNGHVAYFDGWVGADRKQFWCLGGNQRDTLGRVKFSRDMRSLRLLHFATNI